MPGRFCFKEQKNTKQLHRKGVIALKILCVGDIVGRAGTDFFCNEISRIKYDNGADFVIANAENSDDGGVGLSRDGAILLLQYADILTTGNHCFRRCGEELYTEEFAQVLCPANFPSIAPTAGSYTIDTGRYGSLQVINLQGTAFMEPIDSPFQAADKLIKNSAAKYIIVDFHAESTAEKKALGFYLDGKVSAVFGTHTHVQTADEQILPGGTGYITDVGMAGPITSILGVKPALAVQKQRTHRPVRFEVADGPCMLNAVLFTLDDTNGRCTDVKRINWRSSSPP